MTFANFSPNMPQGGFPQGGLAQAMSQQDGGHIWRALGMQRPAPFQMQQQPGPMPTFQQSMGQFTQGRQMPPQQQPQPNPFMQQFASRFGGNMPAGLAAMMR